MAGLDTRAILSAVLLLSAAVVSASAAREFKPGRSDFTEPTHLGRVHVSLDLSRVDGGRKLTGMKIWVVGHPLAWPASLDLQLPNPSISGMTMVSTASYTCIEDWCPDISQWPVMLIIPFGEIVNRAKGARCERSWLYVGILAEKIERISRWDCPPGGVEEPDERVLFGTD